MAGEGASEDATDRLFTVHMLPSNTNANSTTGKTKGSAFPVPDHVTAKGIEKLASAYSEVVYGEKDSTLEFYCRLVRRGEEGRPRQEGDPPTPLSQLVRMGMAPQQNAPVPQQHGFVTEQQQLDSTPLQLGATPEQQDLNATPPSAQPNQGQVQRPQPSHLTAVTPAARPVNGQHTIKSNQQTIKFMRGQTPLNFMQAQQSRETPQISQESPTVSQHTQSSQPIIQVAHTQSQDNNNNTGKKRARSAPEDDEFDRISDYESDNDTLPPPAKKRMLPSVFLSSSPAPSSTIKRTNSNNAWTPEEDANLVSGLRAGLSVAEIAVKYRIDRTSAAMRNRKRELRQKDPDTIPETQVSARRSQSRARQTPQPPPLAEPAPTRQMPAPAPQTGMRQTFFKRDKGKGRAGDAPSSTLRLVSDDIRDSSPAVVVSTQPSHAGSVAEAPLIDLTEDIQKTISNPSSRAGQPAAGRRQSDNTRESSRGQQNTRPPAKRKAADLRTDSEAPEIASEHSRGPAPAKDNQSSVRTGHQPDVNGPKIAPSKSSGPSKPGPASRPLRQEPGQANERSEAGSLRIAEIAANQKAGRSDSEGQSSKVALKASKFDELLGVKQSTSPEEWPPFSISGPRQDILTVGVLPYTSEVHVENFATHTEDYMTNDAIRVAKREDRLADAQEIFDFAKLHMRMWYAVAAQDWEENKRLQARCRRMYRESRVRHGDPPAPRVQKTEQVEVEGEDGVITIEERTWSQTASNIGDYEDMIAEMKKMINGESEECRSGGDGDGDGDDDVREKLVDGPGRILGEEVQNDNGDSIPDDFDFANEQLLREAGQHEADEEVDASSEEGLPALPQHQPGDQADEDVNEADEGVNDADVLRLITSDAAVEAFDVFDEDDNFVGRVLGQPDGAESPMVCRTVITDLEDGHSDNEARRKEIRRLRRKQRKLERKSGRSESVYAPSDAASEAPSVGSFVESAQSQRRRKRHRRSSGDPRSSTLTAGSDDASSALISKPNAQQRVEMPPPPPPAAVARTNERSKIPSKHGSASKSVPRPKRQEPAAAGRTAESSASHVQPASKNPSDSTARPTTGPTEKPPCSDAAKAAADAKNMPPPPVPQQPKGRQPRRKLTSFLGTFNLGLWSPELPREPRVVEQPKPVRLPFDNDATDTETTGSTVLSPTK